MENLGLVQFNNKYKNLKVLVTGHTGFKGSWLLLWLNKLGAKTYCISDKYLGRPNHLNLLKLKLEKKNELLVDLGNSINKKKISNFLNKKKPKIIFHLAAQSLVKKSYKDPLNTWQSNLVGTINLVEICKKFKFLKSFIIITTDKVYKIFPNKKNSFSENDFLGGNDPYSMSKVAIENFVDSIYQKVNFNIITARAGNVIGGGDWGEDRIIPDIVKSIKNNKKLIIRNPNSIRPWQHVLDCLSGYLLLGQFVLDEKINSGSSWNISHYKKNNFKVINIVFLFKKKFKKLKSIIRKDTNIKETKVLNLNSSKIKKILKWKNLWNVNKSITQTIKWYDNFLKNNDSIESYKQLNEYILNAKNKNVKWIKKLK